MHLLYIWINNYKGIKEHGIKLSSKLCITEFDEKVYTEGIREEGREEGLAKGLSRGREEGLRVLVCSLKDFLPDFESVYRAVVRNKEYAHITKEQVRKYF